MSCGSKLEGNAKFCSSCGSSIKAIEQGTLEEASVALHTEALHVPQKTGGTNKKAFFYKTLLIMAVLLVLGVSSVAAFVLHKSPKELYLLSEYNTYLKMKDDVNNKYGDAMEFQKKLLEKPSSSMVTLSGDLELGSEEGNSEYEMVRDLLSQTTLSVKTEQDPLKKIGHYTLALNVDKEKALDVELVQSEEQFGVKIPLLYDQFFYLNFNEYGDFMRMMDSNYEGPETLEFSKFEWKDLELTDEEKKYLQERYSQFLLDQLEDENFEVRKGVEYEHKGEKMNLREVTLKLSPGETKSLINEFMNYIIQDNELHNMIVKRAQKMAEFAATNNEINEDFLDPKEMKKELVKGLKEVKGDLNEVSFPKGFTSQILINNDEQIVERNVKMAFDDGSDQGSVLVTTKAIPYGDDNKFDEFKVELSEEDEELNAVFQITNDVKGLKDSRSEKLKATFYTESEGDIEEEFTLEMNSDIQGEMGNKQDISRKFTIDLSGSDSAKLSGTIKQTSDINVKKEYSNQKFELAIGFDSEYDSGGFTIKLDSKTNLKDKVNIPSLKTVSGEALNIVDLSEDDMYEIQEEVSSNLMELVEKYGLIPEDYYEEDYYEDDGY